MTAGTAGVTQSAFLQEIQDIRRFFHNHLCTTGEQFFCGAETPKGPYRKHVRSVGGLHIGVRVAKINELGGRDVQFLRDLECPGGVGFRRHRRLLAENDVKRPLTKELIDHKLCELVRLVGKDGHRDFEPLQFRKQSGDTRIGPCIVRPPSAIFVGHCRCAFFDRAFIDIACWQSTSDKTLPAVTYEVSVGIDRVDRKTESGEGSVDRVGQVGQRVKQRSVEVKYDGTESYAVSPLAKLSILTRVFVFT